MAVNNNRKSIYNDMTNAERMVCNYLTEINLWWDFERAVYLTDDCDRPRVWTPDFYLPDLGMYIEVVGDSENPNYSWRESIYFKNKVPIIFIHPYDHEDWKGYLLDRMFALHAQRWTLLRQCRPLPEKPVQNS